MFCIEQYVCLCIVRFKGTHRKESPLLKRCFCSRFFDGLQKPQDFFERWYQKTQSVTFTLCLSFSDHHPNSWLELLLRFFFLTSYERSEIHLSSGSLESSAREQKLQRPLMWLAAPVRDEQLSYSHPSYLKANKQTTQALRLSGLTAILTELTGLMQA